MTSFNLNIGLKNSQIWESDFDKARKLKNFPLPWQLQIFKVICE